MKLSAPILIIVFSGIGILSCSEQAAKQNKNATSDTQRSVTQHLAEEKVPFSPDSITCGNLDRKDVIYYLATQQQSNGYPEIDTAQTTVVRGHFVNATDEHTLIYVSGYASGSCGSCCNLLMLLRCEEQPEVIWSGYCGELSRDDIRDLNGDGILEIESTCGTAWMMEVSDRLQVFNFKGGKQHMLFESIATGYDFSGGGDEGFPYHNGDTFSTAYKNRIIDPDGDGVYEVQQARTFAICRGGKTEKEILRKQKSLQDTLLIPLEEKSE